jgi:hypothetical protein
VDISVGKRIQTRSLENPLGFGDLYELVIQVALVLDPEMASYVHDLGDDLVHQISKQL